MKTPEQEYALQLADEWLKTEPISLKIDYAAEIYISIMLRAEYHLPLDEANNLAEWAREQINGTTLNPAH